MFRLIRRIANGIGAISLALAPGAQAKIAPTEPAAAPAYAGPAIWKVADEDTTIYLFGTVHALPPDTKWMDQRIASTLASADELVTEVPLNDMSGAKSGLTEMATLPEGKTLRSLLAPADLDAYIKAMGTLGLPEAMFDRYEPWYAAMMLSLLPMVKQGYSAASGVETTLNGTLAPERKRAALETVAYQLNLLDTLPEDTQASYLHEVSDSVPEMGENINDMVQAWLKGDADELAKLMNADTSDPVLIDRLLYQRNRNWAEWIEQRLKTPGTVFMAVGAGHLAGPGSVQSVLAAKGIEARRQP